MKRSIIFPAVFLCLVLGIHTFYFFGNWGQALAEDENNASLKAAESGLQEGESWVEQWNESGVYGPTEGLSSIVGKASVAAAGVQLQNMVIHGNLYVQKTVGNSAVILNNVTVTGEVYVLGGSSVTVKDGQVNYLELNNEESATSIIAEGSASVWSIRVKSECQLEEKTGPDAQGFGHVYSTTQDTLTLSGNFPTLTVENLKGAVNFISGRIGKVYMESKADGSVLTLGEQTEVEIIDLVSAVHVKGQGIIERVVVLADGSRLDKDAESYEFAEGKSILVNGGVVDAAGKHVVSLQNIGNVELNPGKSTIKTLVADPADAQITVSSSNTGVATVSLSGDKLTIQALSAGRATVTVTAVKEDYSTAKQTFTVTVNTPEQPAVTLQGISGVTLEKGKSDTRKVVTNPADAEVTVSSSNENVAAATLSGNVITVSAKTAGTATISVTAAKSGYIKGGVTFKVTVKEPASSIPTYSVIARKTTLAGRELVVVKLNATDPQNYNVWMADGTQLTYNAEDKVFSGEVKEGVAVGTIKKK